MLPSMAAKYYRVIRWMGYLQHLLVRGGAGDETMDGKADENAGDFIPAVFDFGKIAAALDEFQIDKSTKPHGKTGKKVEQPINRGEACGVKERVVEKGMKNNPPMMSSQPGPTKEGTVHPFARVDLRIGKIVKVEKHPNADRLYVETVDLGEEQPRTVVSGLVEHVPIGALQDRLCVFVCNLKPATLCKVLSTAMLLVAKDEQSGQLEPLIPPITAIPGTCITIDGVISRPDAVIKPKESTWEDVRLLLKMKDGIAHYEDIPLQVGTLGTLSSNMVKNGIIS